MGERNYGVRIDSRNICPSCNKRGDAPYADEYCTKCAKEYHETWCCLNGGISSACRGGCPDK